MVDFVNDHKIIKNSKPDQFYDLKKKEPPLLEQLPSWLERALDRYFKWNDPNALENAKRQAIQEVIMGGNYNERVFRVFGLLLEDYLRIRNQAERKREVLIHLKLIFGR